MRKKTKQMWRSIQNGKEVLVEVGKENELNNEFDWELTHPWRDALEDSIRKIKNNISWPESISNEEKEWGTKEIEAQQEILHLLDYKEELDLVEHSNIIHQKMHNEEMLKKYYSIVVGRKHQFLQKQSDYERKHKHYLFDLEYGFYLRMVTFIEYQLINFVKKNGKLKFGVSESLHYIFKDESLPKLFKEEEKFKSTLKALLENNFVKGDNNGGYIWVGNSRIMKDKLPRDAPGLQLVAFSLAIKPLLTVYNRKGAKMCRVLNEFFSCNYSETLFRGSNRDKAVKYKMHFKFVESIALK